MSDIKVTLDISALTQYLNNFAKEIAKDVEKSVKGLADGAHTKITEKAQSKLHSFRAKYLESLSPPTQIDAYSWVITLNESAAWLEKGKEAWDMKGKEGEWGLLKNPDGRVKKGPNQGRAYKIVPLEHGAPPSEQASGRTLGPDGQPIGKGFEQMTTDKLKGELRKRGIPTGRFNKLEIDPKTGSPRVGPIDPKTGQPTPYKVDGFSINSPYPGKGNTQILDRVGVYQKKNPKTGGVERHFTTFRVAIEGDGKWEHPAAPALNIFEEVQKWAEIEWVSQILPVLLAKYQGK
jgi:hypothetical protein